MMAWLNRSKHEGTQSCIVWNGKYRPLKCEILFISSKLITVINAVSKTILWMLLLTASFASPQSPYYWWLQFMYAVYCDINVSCLIQAIFSLLILHTVSFLLISSLVFPFQIHLYGADATVAFMTVSVFLSAVSSFICGHLLLWSFSIQLCVSDLQFYKHILSCNQGVCVANTIYEWISAYPGNQVSSLEYVMSVVIIYAVLMFGSLNNSEIALSCLPVCVHCALLFPLLFCLVISFFTLFSLKLYHLDCCLKYFCMVLSLFALLSSVRHCSIIFVRNRVPTRLYSVGWHEVSSSWCTCCSSFMESRKDLAIRFYYTCVCVYLSLLYVFVPVPQWNTHWNTPHAVYRTCYVHSS